MKKFIFGFSLFIGLLFSANQSAYACRCFAPPSLPVNELAARAEAESAAVFTGRVLSVKRNTVQGYKLVKLRLKSRWKGDLKRDVTVKTGLGGEDCGFSFRVGASYLVYAKEGEGGGSVPEVTICSRTAKISDAAADLKALGKAR